MSFLLDKFMDYRASQVKMLEDNTELTIGDVTTVNVTLLNGGVQSNVVPPQFQATIDMRLSLQVNHQDFEHMFKTWCDEAGGDITYIFRQKQPYVVPTKIDKSNEYWVAFQEAINDL